MKLQNTINRCPIISKGPTVNIAGSPSIPPQVINTTGDTPTPCPGTGTHHIWDPNSYEHLDGDWIEVVCPECEWVALGILVPNTNDQLETLVPDDSYDANLNGVSMWREKLRPVGSGLKAVQAPPHYKYHTHSKPAINANYGPDWPI